MRSYDKAYRKNQRVFYCKYSNTLRTMPENYCLLSFDTYFIDASIRKNKILALKLILSIPMSLFKHWRD